MLTVTFYGHACVQFASASTRVLCDPHLYDQFAHDLFAIYPRRQIDRAAIERPDALYISHHHRDHFDLRSLANFDRDTPVFVPDSGELVYGLAQLGFTDVRVFRDWETRAIGDLALTFTPSRVRVPENGLVVATATEAIWNLVDTVTDLEIVRRVQRDVLANRRLELLLWPYQPLLEFQVSEGDDLGFPRAKFERALATLATIQPRFAVPYADAQFGTNETAWLNHYRFPVEFGEVTELARRYAPAVELLPAGPSDRIVVDGAAVSWGERAPYIQTIEATAQERCLDTTRGAPEPRAHDLGELATLKRSLAETVEALRVGWASLARSMRPALVIAAEWDAHYDLILEHGDTASVVRFTPGETDVRVFDGEDVPDADGNRVVMRTRLGLLQRILFGELHYISAVIAGLVRFWHRVYRVQNGVLVAPGLLDEYAASSPSDHGQIASGMVFLNLLVGSADRSMKTRYIDSEVQEARRATV